MHIVNYNCTKTLQNTVTLISFVENLLAFLDLKLDFTVLPTCKLNFKAMDYETVGLPNTYCFLDDIIIVSTGFKSDRLS